MQKWEQVKQKVVQEMEEESDEDEPPEVVAQKRIEEWKRSQLQRFVLYSRLAEVPSTAWVLNGLSVDAVYPIVLLYPPETLAPSLPFHNLLLGSLLCP